MEEILPEPPRRQPSFLLSATGCSLKALKTGNHSSDFLSKSLQLANDKSSSASDRIRHLDTFRKHVPSKDECHDLNIPSDRLNMERIHDILYLSGGCLGNRFSPEEILVFINTAKEISSKWKLLEESFENLPSEAKKMKISNDEYLAADCNVTNESIPPLLIDFWKLTNDITLVFENMIALIKSKRGVKTPRNEFKFEKEPEDSSTAMPVWTATLIEKYEKWVQQRQTMAAEHAAARELVLESHHQLHTQGSEGVVRIEIACASSSSVAEMASTQSSSSSSSSQHQEHHQHQHHTHPHPQQSQSQSPHAYKITKGKLACFLSCCVGRHIDCTEDEVLSLLDVLQASNDDKVQVQDSDCSLECVPPCSLKYWASRIHKFLMKVNEIKSMNTDDKSVHAFHLFM